MKTLHVLRAWAPFVPFFAVALGACGSGEATDQNEFAPTEPANGWDASTPASVKDPGTNDRETVRAGERLRPRYLTSTVEATDGARFVSRTFAGWADTKRGENCSPLLGGDDKIRCFPSATPTDGHSAALRFGDSACTRLDVVWMNVVLPAARCVAAAPAQYVSEPPEKNDKYACGAPQTALRKIGNQVTRAYWIISGKCEESRISGTFYQIGDPIAFDEFVEVRSATVED